jgi:two-component system, NarL family, nitrate/nitrite response regulator NarL
MGQCGDATIIESRALMREALISLMTSHSYHVVGAVASTTDIDKSMLDVDAPRLVLLGALPAEDAIATAGSIRRLWPETKIILLFEHASSADFEKMLASEIDGCIPLSASSDVLVGALRQIVAANHRIMVLETATCSPMRRAADWHEEDDGLDPGEDNPAPKVGNGATEDAISIRIPHGLSEREQQILRGLVKGQSNKLIARTCGVADATIKVHVKSILRKIRVVNRTQAAIWALERGYGADDVKDQAVAGRVAQDTPKYRRVESTPSTVMGIAD